MIPQGPCATCGRVIEPGVPELWCLDDRKIAEFCFEEVSIDPQEYVFCSQVCCHMFLLDLQQDKAIDVTPLEIDAHHRLEIT